MAKANITVVGSFAVGMTLRTERMPHFGETLLGSDFDLGPGGKGSNQAVAVARLGASSRFVGLICEDTLGRIALDLYEAEGVDTSKLQQTKNRATGVGFIIINNRGENGIILDMGANELIDAAFVDGAEDLIRQSDLVMAVFEIPPVAALRAMELGKKHGVRTLLNPAPGKLLDKAALPFIDILTPNETELRILMGLAPNDPTPTPELARQLKDQGVNTVIVTMGEQGSLILDETETHVPPVKVDVVDTTGAGDAFNAGFAVKLAEGKSILEATQFGNCTGALACTKLGVIPALAKRETAEELYAKHFGGQ
jgi:ribokinase